MKIYTTSRRRLSLHNRIQQHAILADVAFTSLQAAKDHCARDAGLDPKDVRCECCNQITHKGQTIDWRPRVTAGTIRGKTPSRNGYLEYTICELEVQE